MSKKGKMTCGYTATLAWLGCMLVVAGCEMRQTADVQDAPASDAMTNVLTDAEKADGWMLLFDGTSLDQWRGYRMDRIPAGWSVQDGAIYCSGADSGDLITKAQFQNFDFKLDWKISPAGNSGIFYRLLEIYDVAWKTGTEYQILDNQGHPDAANGLNRTAAAAYDVYAPTKDASRPAGEWNQTRIVVNGTNVEHWLNGELVVEYELFSDEWEARLADSKWAGNTDFGRMKTGHIGLQDHGDEVWYRNVRIKKLPDTR